MNTKPRMPMPKDGQHVRVVTDHNRVLSAVYRIDKGFLVESAQPGETAVAWIGAEGTVVKCP